MTNKLTNVNKKAYQSLLRRFLNNNLLLIILILFHEIKLVTGLTKKPNFITIILQHNALSK